MIHLRVRTEYSFRRAFGKLDHVATTLKGLLRGSESAIAITDTGTWGFVAWQKACKAAGVRPIFGITVAVVGDCELREQQPAALCTILARNTLGVQELYKLVTKANRVGFYYHPRLDYDDINSTSENVTVLMGYGTALDRMVEGRDNVYLAMCPTNRTWNRVVKSDARFQHVVVCDNHYPTIDDASAYEILSQRDATVMRATAMHLMSEDHLRLGVQEAGNEEFANVLRIADDCNATLPVAKNIEIRSAKTLHALCMEGASRRSLAMNEEYVARLKRELDMIAQKDFESYFFMLTEMIGWAKSRMLVGPARGSSAGSLACFLLGITDVDPIVHDLMFERFIDITRADLPDIDIDFQDSRRDLVLEHLKDHYGEERVGRIGTVSRLKAKSALGDVATAFSIPPREMRPVLDAMIERSTGDARAQFCVKDALESLEVGKALASKFPAILLAGNLEGHAQHTGKHAAGVIVANDDVVNYCSLDQSGVAQIDKKDAEKLNMLKIDALGLRVLSVIQDTLDQIGQDRDWLIGYRLDDEAAFQILRDERFSGIFQFEGYALQALTRQMKVERFDDVAVLGALARPGPLHSGAATQFIARRNGKESVHHVHELAEPVTRDTYGVVVYQEQVMALGRVLGKLSWEDVSELRKAMSKSLGEEFFNKYWERFRDGASEHGIDSGEAKSIWDSICTFGSWAFNKSHAVSYGLISYWCLVLKAHWPLQFAAACLRNEKDEAQGVSVLRDLMKRGYKYKAVDVDKSGLDWSVADGELIGGLVNIKGVGEKKALDIIARRERGEQMPPGMAKLLAEAKTPYDDVFAGERRWADVYQNPQKYNVISGKISRIEEINKQGEYVFLAKLMERNLRDLNEYGNVVKRGGRIIDKDPLFLNLTIEDDTSAIMARVSRWDYQQWGKPLIEQGREGEWFLWKGTINEDGFRLVNVQRWRAMEPDSPLYRPFVRTT